MHIDETSPNQVIDSHPEILGGMRPNMSADLLHLRDD